MRTLTRNIPNHARFRDRVAAGRALAAELRAYAGRSDVVVLGLPRGGVPVAAEVARALDAPLDVFLVRKLGVPGHPEFAMGAIAAGGVLDLNWVLIGELGISEVAVHEVARAERTELARRELAYRRGRVPADVRGRVAILVDDGLATGSTMRAAALAIRHLAPARIVAAVPTASPQACQELGLVVDECVCLIQPEPFEAVGLWYEEFQQTNDAEVVECLERYAREREERARPRARPVGGASNFVR